MPERLRHLDICLHVEPGLHAVARDVGVDDVPKARLAHLAGQIACSDARTLDPSGDGDFPALRVDAGGEPVAPHALHRRACELGVVYERGTEHHARSTDVREALEGLKCADAAADFHGKRGLPHDALDDGDVFGHARARAVEVDHVNPGGALGLELPRLVNGIVVIDRHLGIIPLGKAHGVAFQDIDCREKVHVSAFLSEINAAGA